MLIGHNAVGFASKRVAPRVSLGWLMAAPMLLDLLWPILLIAGVEHLRIKPGITAMNPMDFVNQIAWVTLSLWLFPFWAAWIDRHREART